MHARGMRLAQKRGCLWSIARKEYQADALALDSVQDSGKIGLAFRNVLHESLVDSLVVKVFPGDFAQSAAVDSWVAYNCDLAALEIADDVLCRDESLKIITTAGAENVRKSAIREHRIRRGRRNF